MYVCIYTHTHTYTYTYIYTQYIYKFVVLRLFPLFLSSGGRFCHASPNVRAHVRRRCTPSTTKLLTPIRVSSTVLTLTLKAALCA